MRVRLASPRAMYKRECASNARQARYRGLRQIISGRENPPCESRIAGQRSSPSPSGTKAAKGQSTHLLPLDAVVKHKSNRFELFFEWWPHLYQPASAEGSVRAESCFK